MKVNWAALTYDRREGYSRYSLSTIQALLKAGVDVVPCVNEQIDTMPGWMLDLCNIDLSIPTIFCTQPQYIPDVDGRLWSMTMFEADTIPSEWPGILNSRCERIIVPCEHNARVFCKSGVTIPVHVVHGGTDPNEFPVLGNGNGNGNYTFLCLGDRGSRKGQDLAWKAFWKAFGTQDDVRLVIKVRPNSMKYIDEEGSDKRVSMLRGDVDSMSYIYPLADCFVFPSRGEGWGMPPREAASMGIPVITTRYAGLEVGIDDWALPINNITMKPSILLRGGKWACPDVDELAEKMRWCYDNQREARNFGLNAAQWLRSNQSWDHSAQQWLDLFHEVM